MFYLPLSSDQADRLASAAVTEFFTTASVLDAAAVLFVQNLPRQPAIALSSSRRPKATPCKR